MTLKEIASRIDAHLKRFEADPKINKTKRTGGMKLSRFYNAGSTDSGRCVYVCYVAYRGNSHLSKPEGTRYLAWLDAGNVGTHRQALRAKS